MLSHKGLSEFHKRTKNFISEMDGDVNEVNVGR